MSERRRSNHRVDVLLNRRRPCDHRGCAKCRKALSRHCVTHARLAGLYGHPDGHLIPKHRYTSYVKVARRILKERQGHPAIIAAEDMIRLLITQGAEPQRPLPLRLNPRWLLWRELGRLHNRPDGLDVTPREALATVMGVWLLSYHQPRVLPSDNRLTYQIAQAVLRLRRLDITSSYYNHETDEVENQYRACPGLAVGLLGKRIRTTLAPFLANVTKLIEDEYQREQAKARALATPFTIEGEAP